MRLRCMIIDDDEMSRLVVKKFIEKTDFLELVYEMSTADEAISILKKDEDDLDVIFLDVEMPGMSGLELMKTIENSYQVIMVTSSGGYAVQAFEGSVTDYLVKPFEYDRFQKASFKALQNVQIQREKAESISELYIKVESKHLRIPLEDLYFIEALADYVIMVTAKGKLIGHYTMKSLEKKLPKKVFQRVHRSYIVNLKHIDYYEDTNLMIKGKVIPTSTTYREFLFAKMYFL